MSNGTEPSDRSSTPGVDSETVNGGFVGGVVWALLGALAGYFIVGRVPAYYKAAGAVGGFVVVTYNYALIWFATRPAPETSGTISRFELLKSVATGTGLLVAGFFAFIKFGITDAKKDLTLSIPEAPRTCVMIENGEPIGVRISATVLVENNGILPVEELSGLDVGLYPAGEPQTAKLSPEEAVFGLAGGRALEDSIPPGTSRKLLFRWPVGVKRGSDQQRLGFMGKRGIPFPERWRLETGDRQLVVRVRDGESADSGYEAVYGLAPIRVDTLKVCGEVEYGKCMSNRTGSLAILGEGKETDFWGCLDRAAVEFRDKPRCGGHGVGGQGKGDERGGTPPDPKGGNEGSSEPESSGRDDKPASSGLDSSEDGQLACQILWIPAIVGVSGGGVRCELNKPSDDSKAAKFEVGGASFWCEQMNHCRDKACDFVVPTHASSSTSGP